MEYTIQEFAQLAGVSTRTLRYYDEIGLLNPARTNSSGYRIYGPSEVSRLQQILFYRELGVNLETIKEIMNSASYDAILALKEHQQKLLEKRATLDKLIHNVEKTILQSERGIPMSDQEKFEGFKEKQIEENEKQYGQEIREKYGDQVVNASNAKLKNMSEEQYKAITKLEIDLIDQLKIAMKTGNPASKEGQQVAALHKEWLSFHWNSYSKKAHAGVAQMYVTDDRFTDYYNSRAGSGAAEFLKDAILVYTS